MKFRTVETENERCVGCPSGGSPKQPIASLNVINAERKDPVKVQECPSRVHMASYAIRATRDGLVSYSSGNVIGCRQDGDEPLGLHVDVANSEGAVTDVATGNVTTPPACLLQRMGIEICD